MAISYTIPVNVLSSCVASLALMVGAHASAIVLDSFTEGAHSLSAGGTAAHATAVSSPLGTTRRTRISSTLAPHGATLSSTLEPINGALEFQVSGASTIDGRPLDLRMSYLGGGPFNLLGYSAFEFDFAVINGNGHLIIELGSGSDVYGPDTNRIPLDRPGTAAVPFTKLNLGPGGSVDSFYVFNVVIEAVSEEFTFTLTEIRLVPEPSMLALLAGGSMCWLLRRRT